MDEQSRKRTSKRLSYVLRHRPDSVGLVCDPRGWVAVDALLAALAAHGEAISHDDLVEVVSTNAKQRFAFSEDGARIRASQGHSIDVELGYAPATPPDTLFHGTHVGVVEAIQREGLLRGERHHVHLSADADTARSVGARRGRPVVLVVVAAVMNADGFAFFLSDNGVWLTEHVPPRYLRAPADDGS